VKAVSLRQASRVSNSIRSGYPVRRFEELARSQVVLICVPDARLPGVVSGLAASAVRWTGKSVLVCEGSRGSEALEELAVLGAETASMSSMHTADRPRFLVEGSQATVGAARALVEEAGGKVVEVQAGSHGLCAASAAFASWLCQPLMDASAECLRHAGLSQGSAGAIVERTVLQSLRSYIKGGHRACKSPSTIEERQAFLRQLTSLRRQDPALAEFFQRAAIDVLHRHRRSTKWIELNSPVPARSAAAG